MAASTGPRARKAGARAGGSCRRVGACSAARCAARTQPAPACARGRPAFQIDTPQPRGLL